MADHTATLHAKLRGILEHLGTSCPDLFLFIADNGGLTGVTELMKTGVPVPIVDGITLTAQIVDDEMTFTLHGDERARHNRRVLVLFLERYHLQPSTKDNPLN